MIHGDMGNQEPPPRRQPAPINQRWQGQRPEQHRESKGQTQQNEEKLEE